MSKPPGLFPLRTEAAQVRRVMDLLARAGEKLLEHAKAYEHAATNLTRNADIRRVEKVQEAYEMAADVCDRAYADALGALELAEEVRGQVQLGECSGRLGVLAALTGR